MVKYKIGDLYDRPFGPESDNGIVIGVDYSYQVQIQSHTGRTFYSRELDKLDMHAEPVASDMPDILQWLKIGYEDMIKDTATKSEYDAGYEAAYADILENYFGVTAEIIPASVKFVDNND